MINYDVISNATVPNVGTTYIDTTGYQNCYPVYPYVPAPLYPYPYQPWAPNPVYYPVVQPYFVPFPQKMSDDEMDDLAERIAKKMREKKR